jgi:RsiW-degrading membrane proteinase PrsW (M82 family)
MRNFSLIVIAFIFVLGSFFVAVATTENSIDYICPPDSYLKNGLCYCEEGFIWNEEKSKCITPNEWCHNRFPDERIRAVQEQDEYGCYCVSGYIWNDKLKKCITYTESCHLLYGEHTIGNKDYCDCEKGYPWNSDKSQCISRAEAFIEYLHFGTPAFILGLMPILIWFLIVALLSKLIFGIKLSIKRSLVFFGAGMIITPFIWLLENYLLDLFQINIHQALPLVVSVGAYLMIAGVEEVAKFLTAQFIIIFKSFFSEIIDVVIYLVILALGFAFAENILIAYQEISLGNDFSSAIQIMSMRFMSANLLHILSSGIIGCFWALSLFKNKEYYLHFGVFFGIVLHAIFNIAIMNLTNINLISLLFFGSMVLLLALGFLEKIRASSID